MNKDDIEDDDDDDCENKAKAEKARPKKRKASSNLKKEKKNTKKAEEVAQQNEDADDPEALVNGGIAEPHEPTTPSSEPMSSYSLAGGATASDHPTELDNDNDISMRSTTSSNLSFNENRATSPEEDLPPPPAYLTYRLSLYTSNSKRSWPPPLPPPSKPSMAAKASTKGLQASTKPNPSSRMAQQQSGPRQLPPSHARHPQAPPPSQPGSSHRPRLSHQPRAKDAMHLSRPSQPTSLQPASSRKFFQPHARTLSEFNAPLPSQPLSHPPMRFGLSSNTANRNGSPPPLTAAIRPSQGSRKNLKRGN
ncbi:hypothetical protein BDZ97DRAFT_1924312 [Flammula alnicola]|nr:hypothetical protein BDZ97DRAFT_1924312 [Flammula alnicola]